MENNEYFMEINYSSQTFITRSYFMDTDYFARRLITLYVNLRFSTEINHSSRRSIAFQVFTEIDDYTRTPMTNHSQVSRISITPHRNQSLLTENFQFSRKSITFHEDYSSWRGETSNIDQINLVQEAKARSRAKSHGVQNFHFWGLTS